MISDEERREVAKRLRALASHREADKDMVLDAIGLYMGECLDGFDPVSVNSLADLIDRPTCEVLYYEQESSNKMAKPCEEADADFVQCGNCENWMQWVWDYENHNWCAPKYCSCCGAEVVRDGD